MVTDQAGGNNQPGASGPDDALGLTAVEERRVGFYAASANSAATRRAYLGAWRGFTGRAADTGRPPRGKAPLLTPDLAALRDRALLLVAFTTALRRSGLRPDVVRRQRRGPERGRRRCHRAGVHHPPREDRPARHRPPGRRPSLSRPRRPALPGPRPTCLAAGPRARPSRPAAPLGALTKHDSSLHADGPVFRPVTRHGHAEVPGRGRATNCPAPPSPTSSSGTPAPPALTRPSWPPTHCAAATPPRPRRTASANSRSPNSSASSTGRPAASTSAAPAPPTTAPAATWACRCGWRRRPHHTEALVQLAYDCSATSGVTPADVAAAALDAALWQALHGRSVAGRGEALLICCADVAGRTPGSPTTAPRWGRVTVWTWSTSACGTAVARPGCCSRSRTRCRRARWWR